jgi:hypothetical protein
MTDIRMPLKMLRIWVFVMVVYRFGKKLMPVSW